MINFPSEKQSLNAVYIWSHKFLDFFVPSQINTCYMHFTPTASIIGDKTVQYLSLGFRTFLPLLNGIVQSGILVQQFSHSTEIKTQA